MILLRRVLSHLRLVRFYVVRWLADPFSELTEVAALKLKLLFFFFFSSRRRHTRYIGDWSSDVCSSDLAADAARRDQLHLAVVAAVFESPSSLRDGRERWNSCVILEDLGRCTGAALHPVDDDHVRAALGGQDRKSVV